jgi:hypothetical protein
MNKDTAVEMYKEWANAYVQEHGTDDILTTGEIKEFIAERFPERKTTIYNNRPTDFCYNRINSGDMQDFPTLFEYVDRGQFRCLGSGAEWYNGKVYHAGLKIHIGRCQNGIRPKWNPDSNNNNIEED